MEAAPNKRSYIRLAAIRALLMGFDALATKPRSGRPRKVKLERVGDLVLPVLDDPSLAGETHWTGRKLHGYLNQKLGLDLGYTTVLRWLHQLDFHLRVPRPWPEGQDEGKRAAFLKEMRQLCDDPTVELWFSDESGFEGDPRPRRRWVRPDSKPTVPYLGQTRQASDHRDGQRLLA